jgi:hypothetical protein
MLARSISSASFSVIFGLVGLVLGVLVAMGPSPRRLWAALRVETDPSQSQIVTITAPIECAMIALIPLMSQYADPFCS